MRTPIILSAAMLATNAPAQMKPIAFTEFDLDNGLHVIVHEDRSTPIVAVSVMYHVGSKNEREDRRGFAHFFEHLLFEGSENIARGEFSKYVEGAGGVLNANTNGDRTYYYEVLPSNQLELGLWLESERMMHARVDQVGIDTQREVVKEERRQRYENQPYGSILIEVLKRAYTVHPYKWPTIGFMEDLNAASEKDYKDFYETYYVPNNAVLVVAGDVDPKEARRLVEAYFGPIARGRDLTRRQVEEPVLKGEVRDVVYDNIQLPAVVQAYRIPAYGTPDFYAVDMVNRLLSSGNSSRLQKALKDEQQKALYVGAFSFPFEDPGLAIAFAIANAGVDAQALEEAMDAEVLRLQQDLVQEEELAKLKAQLETEQVMDNARIAGVASNLASAYTFLGDARAASTEIERYLAITPKDIQRAATTYFNRDSRVVLHYLPKSQKN
ncbi:MAG: pitrilysin family protein [Flavobacteriales bacterium]|nr:insulinase family protein [Flavobacteriales bacterium]MCB0808954.1 insulinase family protein [Flavobacteriales bacterium]MCB9181640.1 insulinase family protein [Flavobacteriales bacterium]MCB9199996.1 insulinase family protein [Flavobacteriales bacterium]